MSRSAPRAARKTAAPAQPGRVVAAYGRRFRVEVADGALFDCVTRGKTRDVACGDRVHVAQTGPGLAVIESVAPRTSLFYRSDVFREKFFAANVSQIVAVVAPVPTPHFDLLDRCLVAAEHAGIAAFIVANKNDKPEFAAFWTALAVYRNLGYRTLPLNAKADVTMLAPLLAQEVSILVGQSGMGKSTIINRLVPDAAARTGALSTALDSGTHTTTHAELFHLPGGGDIVDSPGMQAFGLNHIEPRELAEGYRELRPLAAECRFRDCLHLQEPGCAVNAAVAAGRITALRYGSYRRLVEERLAQEKRQPY